MFVRGMTLDDKSSQTAFVIPLCSWEVSVPSVFVRGMCSWEVISNCSCHTSVIVGGVCSLCVCGRCVFPLCSWEVCVPFVFVGGIPRPVGYLTGRQVRACRREREVCSLCVRERYVFLLCSWEVSHVLWDISRDDKSSPTALVIPLTNTLLCDFVFGECVLPCTPGAQVFSTAAG